MKRVAAGGRAVAEGRARVFVALLVLLAVRPAAARCDHPPTVPRSMDQVQHVTVSSAAGRSRETVRRLRWRREEDGTLKARVGIVAPQRDAGLEVLIVAAPATRAVVYVATPDTGRVRRLTGAGASASALGSALTFEDLLAIERLLDAAVDHTGPASRLAGRDVFAIDAVIDAATPVRLRAQVDRAWCVPLAIEFLTTEGAIEKTLTVDAHEIRAFGEHHVAMRTEIVQHRLATRTTLRVSEVVVDAALPAHLFTPQDLEQGR